MDGKKVKGQGEFVESNYVMNTQRRKEGRSLLLHFDVSSAIKEARVLEARSGRVFGRFEIQMIRERLSRYPFVECNRMGQAGKPDDLLSGSLTVVL